MKFKFRTQNLLNSVHMTIMDESGEILKEFFDYSEKAANDRAQDWCRWFHKNQKEEIEEKENNDTP